MASDLASDEHAGVASPSIQDRLLPNTLYLTFNRPQKDEFHRAIFITASRITPRSPDADEPEPEAVGTLFHAVYENEAWRVERRSIRNIDGSKNLVLLWKIAPVRPCGLARIDDILNAVPFHAPHGAAARRLSLHVEKGRPLLGGYSCILWTEEALRALERDGVIQVTRDIGEVMAQARAEAGPEDATQAVEKDFGGARVQNNFPQTQPTLPTD